MRIQPRKKNKLLTFLNIDRTNDISARTLKMMTVMRVTLITKILSLKGGIDCDDLGDAHRILPS
jgi:hypothetical protein